MTTTRMFAITTDLLLLGTTLVSAQTPKPAGEMMGHHTMEGQAPRWTPRRAGSTSKRRRAP
jgi:hypothetical protein